MSKMLVPARPFPGFKPRHTRIRKRTERGAATAEYAVSIVGACGFAGILAALLQSDVMMNVLKAIINFALKAAGVDGIQV
ncbi:MAG TPA: DUF4244 domain-containing protein [Kribbella sp.]|uniref:DUF4244 domain-containing protein n=1 Tax=Kribbella sp. TaxID=1871183 RepID=UPI002D791AC4|nr:DUF4244 domain-containing protein [Kribbella sp.]HET6296827.1 DUF4244 domain-containing protein [Kribbella sp.]